MVRYVSGPELSSDQIEYAGVFITNPEVDAIFAKAEPPTHDDWVLEGLQDPREKSSVRVALRRIDESLGAFAGPPATEGVQRQEHASLGSLGDELGSLIPADEGPGAQETDHPPDRLPRRGAPAGRGRAHVVPLDAGRIEILDGQPIVIISFELRHGPGAERTIVSAQPLTLLDNGEAEREPPIGGAVPQVVFWRGPGGSRPGAPEIDIASVPPGPWEVAVSLPGDAMIGVDLTARAGTS